MADTHTISQEEISEEIRYCTSKLAQTIDEHTKKRLEKKIAMLEDSIIVYLLRKGGN